MAHRGLFWYANAAWFAATVGLLPALAVVPDANTLAPRVANDIFAAIYLGWFAAAVAMGAVIGPVGSAGWRLIGIYAAMTVGLPTGAWIADHLFRAAHPHPDVDGPPPVSIAIELYAVGGVLVLLGILGAGITRWMWRLLRRRPPLRGSADQQEREGRP